MSMFENIGKKKTEKKVDQEQKEQRIDNTEYMTGLSSLKTTTEHLDKMDQVANLMKETENHDGDYVENEYDLKKQELNKHVNENITKKSKWVKSTVIQGLLAAGIVADVYFKGPIMGNIMNYGGSAEALTELGVGAITILSTLVTGGIAIAKIIKTKFETNRSMAKFITGKVEGLGDKESDILAKSKNWWDGAKKIQNIKDNRHINYSHAQPDDKSMEESSSVYNKFKK